MINSEEVTSAKYRDVIANNEEMKFDIYEKDFGYLKIKL